MWAQWLAHPYQLAASQLSDLEYLSSFPSLPFYYDALRYWGMALAKSARSWTTAVFCRFWRSRCYSLRVHLLQPMNKLR
jgi:hypothetical protein